MTSNTESFFAKASGEQLQLGPCLWLEPLLGSALFPGILATTEMHCD